MRHSQQSLLFFLWLTWRALEKLPFWTRVIGEEDVLVFCSACYIIFYITFIFYLLKELASTILLDLFSSTTTIPYVCILKSQFQICGFSMKHRTCFLCMFGPLVVITPSSTFIWWTSYYKGRAFNVFTLTSQHNFPYTFFPSYFYKYFTNAKDKFSSKNASPYFIQVFI